MPKLGQATKHARAVTVIQALKKVLPPRWRGKIGGRSFTRAQLLAIYEAELEALAVVRAAHAQLRAAVARERRAEREVRRVTGDLVALVSSQFGVGSVEYGLFGWKPPGKPGPKTAQAKARMVERARENRGRRGGPHP